MWYLTIPTRTSEEAQELYRLCRQFGTVEQPQLGRINNGPLVLLVFVGGPDTEADIESPLADALTRRGREGVWSDHRPANFQPIESQPSWS